MKYTEGEIVTVKLQGGISVPGTILSKKKAKHYLVEYSDGATHEINESHIFPNPKGQISPLGARRARMASPARQTSPARQRSPSRRSPSRKIKSSPSPSREKSTRKKSPSRILKLTMEKVDDTPLAVREVVNRSFPKRRRPIEHDGSSPNIDLNGSGDSNNLKSPIVTEKSLNSSKILHLKPDYENSVIEPAEKSLKFDAKYIKSEFGGWPGALISIFLFPVSIFALNVMCNKKMCDWNHFPKISLKFDTYYNQHVMILTTGYITLITLLSFLPFVGKKLLSPVVTRQSKKVYKMNGLFSLLVVIIAIIVLEMYNFPVLQTIRDRYLQLCVLSLIIGLVMSLAMFIHAHYLPVSELNTHAVTGNFIYDFFMGRTTSPRILGIDMKLTTLRASLIAVIIINAAFVIKGIQRNLLAITTETHKPTYWDVTEYTNMDLAVLITAALFISLYAFDHLLFESHILTTFEFMYEGFGYMICMGYCAFPFMTTMITKYSFEHGIQWNLWQLVLVWMFYLPALMMYRLINAQKNTFRSNPYNPAVAHLESIPTSQGKKLLVSGYWGFVRHPNYLADLVLHSCLYSLTPCAPPAVTVLCSIFYILYRIRRDGNRCQAKYGVAWDRYCHRVRYNLIPKVF